MKNKCILTLLSVYMILIFTGCSNKYCNLSDYKEKKYSGVSMRVEATAKSLTYYVSSSDVQINFSEFETDVTLEKLIEGSWCQIPKKDGTFSGLGHSASPESYYVNTIQWKTYYKANLDKGTYRVIFSFFVDSYQNQYNVLSEFMIQ